MRSLVVIYHLQNGVAGDENAMAGDALAEQVGPAALGVGHEHVAGVIDNAAVDFLGHAVVVAAVARLHVIHRNAHALGYKGRQSAVGIAQNKHAIGPLLLEYRLDSGQNHAHLFAETAALRPEIIIRRAYFEIAEKNIVQVGIVVLAGVDQHVIGQSVEFFNDPAEADDFRPCAQHCGNFHRKNSPSAASTSSKRRRFSFNRTHKSS